MNALTLYSTPLCPFAHRVRIVISEKRLPARIIEVDLRDKPAELLEISPGGKVPVLKHGECVVLDSSVINEYLDVVFPDVPMMPRDALAHAWARQWIHFADESLFSHTSQLLHGSSSSMHAQLLAKIEQDLLHLETHAFAAPPFNPPDGALARGPYWMGAEFSLVDAAFYPWFEQFEVLEAFFGFRWPLSCQRLARWRSAVAERPSVAAIAQAPDFYLHHYGLLQKARA